MTSTKTRIANYVRTVRAMILEDVRDGHVPPTVRDFSQLHDHLDANDYLAQAGVEWGDSGDTEADLADVNAVQDAVHEWLRGCGIMRDLLADSAVDEWDAYNELPFLIAYRDDVDSWTPDETTAPYTRAEIAELVEDIIRERVA